MDALALSASCCSTAISVPTLVQASSTCLQTQNVQLQECAASPDKVQAKRMQPRLSCASLAVKRCSRPVMARLFSESCLASRWRDVASCSYTCTDALQR